MAGTTIASEQALESLTTVSQSQKTIHMLNAICHDRNTVSEVIDNAICIKKPLALLLKLAYKDFNKTKKKGEYIHFSIVN